MYALAIALSLAAAVAFAASVIYIDSLTGKDGPLQVWRWQIPLGISLLMAALARGDFGIVTTMSSTTPILILPMVWALYGRKPDVAA